MFASAVVLDIRNTSNHLDFPSTIYRRMSHSDRYLAVAIDGAATSKGCLMSPEIKMHSLTYFAVPPKLFDIFVQCCPPNM